MTRPYFQVYGANTVGKAKWRRLRPAERGALLTLWMAGSIQDDEGVWPTRDAVVDDLDAEGFDNAAEIVDRLVALRWLDCDDRGCRVHEWQEWQPSLPKSGKQRTRAWRGRKFSTLDGGNTVGNVTERDARSSHASLVTLGEERREERTSSNEPREEERTSSVPSARRNGAPQSLGDVLSSLQVGAKAPSLTGDEGSDRQSPAVPGQRTGESADTAPSSRSRKASRRSSSDAEPGERLAEPDLTIPDGPGG